MLAVVGVIANAHAQFVVLLVLLHAASSQCSLLFFLFSYIFSLRQASTCRDQRSGSAWRKIAPSIYPPTTYGVIWGRGKTAPRYCQTNTGQGPWIWELMEEPEPGETLTIVEHKHPSLLHIPPKHTQFAQCICGIIEELVCSGSL